MNRNFNFLYPYLEKLSAGRTLHYVVCWLLKFWVMFYGLLNVYIIIQLFEKISFSLDFFRALLAGLVILAGWWIIAQVGFYRADKIIESNDDSLPAITIFVQLFRLSGEIMAITILTITIAELIMGGDEVSQFYNWIPFFSHFAFYKTDSSLLEIFIFLFAASFYSIIVWLAFYFLAEATEIGSSMLQTAKSTNKMLAEGAAMQKLPGIPEVLVPFLESQCPRCNAIVGPEDYFCMNCGNKLK